MSQQAIIQPELTLAEVPQLYQQGVGKLKSQKVFIKACEKLLELKLHGRQASSWWHKKREAEDEYRQIQCFTSALKSRQKQLKAETHKAQRLQKRQEIEQAKAHQAAKRAEEKGKKRTVAKPLQDSKRARVSAAARQVEEQNEANQEVAQCRRMKRERIVERAAAQQEAEQAIVCVEATKTIRKLKSCTKKKLTKPRSMNIKITNQQSWRKQSKPRMNIG